MPRRTFENHDICPVCGKDAGFTLDVGGKRTKPYMQFNGHTGPNEEKVICSDMIVFRGQRGWNSWAEWMTDKTRHAEGWE